MSWGGSQFFITFVFYSERFRKNFNFISTGAESVKHWKWSIDNFYIDGDVFHENKNENELRVFTPCVCAVKRPTRVVFFLRFLCSVDTTTWHSLVSLMKKTLSIAEENFMLYVAPSTSLSPFHSLMPCFCNMNFTLHNQLHTLIWIFPENNLIFFFISGRSAVVLNLRFYFYTKKLILALNFESRWPLISSLNIQRYYQPSCSLKNCYRTSTGHSGVSCRKEKGNLNQFHVKPTTTTTRTIEEAKSVK